MTTTVPWWVLLLVAGLTWFVVIMALRRAHDLGMHLGVTWPEDACRRLNRHGYNMDYKLREMRGGKQ